jgi:hypothetical protein
MNFLIEVAGWVVHRLASCGWRGCWRMAWLSEWVSEWVSEWAAVTVSRCVLGEWVSETVVEAEKMCVREWMSERAWVMAEWWWERSESEWETEWESDEWWVMRGRWVRERCKSHPSVLVAVSGLASAPQPLTSSCVLHYYCDHHLFWSI